MGTVSSSFQHFAEKRGEYEKPGAGAACLGCPLHARPWVLPRKGRLGGVVLTGPPNGDFLLALVQALLAVVPPPAHPGMQAEHSQAATPAPMLQGFAVHLYFRSHAIAFLRSALRIATAPSFCSRICRVTEALPER